MRSRTMRKEAMDIVGSGVGVGGGDSGGGGGGDDCGGGGGGGGGDATNKSSLALGRTSAGSVWCFWGMFSTIPGSRKSKCVSTFLSQNIMHLK